MGTDPHEPHAAEEMNQLSCNSLVSRSFTDGRILIMKFGYTIIYVADVQASATFFETAFGIKTRFTHESGYAELETGATALAFATHELGRSNVPSGYVAADTSARPLGMEIALVTSDVSAAHARAVAAGAKSISEPAQKPWGQTVSYVRCPDGTLVELCTPVNS